MKKIFSKEWLKAAFIRAFRTMAQVAPANIGSAAILADVNWLVVLSASVLSAILSLLTSVDGLPEIEGVETSWLKAALVRALKTIAQSGISVIGSAALISEVNWPVVASSAILAGIVSMLMSIGGLPEASTPIQKE
ncbi:MAG: hypothetical protein GX939_03735 [Clostridiaceae bacterium]|jgi:hypothetical protein|nr:hypothetical protein [Clostridiaceae bacterium]